MIFRSRLYVYLWSIILDNWGSNMSATCLMCLKECLFVTKYTYEDYQPLYDTKGVWV